MKLSFKFKIQYKTFCLIEMKFVNTGGLFANKQMENPN